ncbi:MAG: hypothetical protein ACRCXZ_09360, partial [Patescibacteria group bacterium]
QNLALYEMTVFYLTLLVNMTNLLRRYEAARLTDNPMSLEQLNSSLQELKVVETSNIYTTQFDQLLTQIDETILFGRN